MRLSLRIFISLGLIFTSFTAFADLTSGESARKDINTVAFSGRETSWRGVNLETRCGVIVRNDRRAGSTLIAISTPLTEGQWLVTDLDTEVTPGVENDPTHGVVVIRDLNQGKYLRIENRWVYGRRTLFFSIQAVSSWRVECEVINPFGPFNPLGNP